MAGRAGEIDDTRRGGCGRRRRRRAAGGAATLSRRNRLSAISDIRSSRPRRPRVVATFVRRSNFPRERFSSTRFSLFTTTRGFALSTNDIGPMELSFVNIVRYSGVLIFPNIFRFI